MPICCLSLCHLFHLYFIKHILGYLMPLKNTFLKSSQWCRDSSFQEDEEMHLVSSVTCTPSHSPRLITTVLLNVVHIFITTHMHMDLSHRYFDM